MHFQLTDRWAPKSNHSPETIINNATKQHVFLKSACTWNSWTLVLYLREYLNPGWQNNRHCISSMYCNMKPLWSSEIVLEIGKFWMNRSYRVFWAIWKGGPLFPGFSSQNRPFNLIFSWNSQNFGIKGKCFRITFMIEKKNGKQHEQHRTTARIENMNDILKIQICLSWRNRQRKQQLDSSQEKIWEFVWKFGGSNPVVNI